MRRILCILAVLLVFMAEGFATDFDPAQPDYDLLRQLILERINQKRQHRNKPVFSHNKELQQSADYYTQKYILRRFQDNSENKLFIRKKIRKICATNGFNPRLINFSICHFGALKFYGSKFYYDNEDGSSPLHLYRGEKKPGKKERESDDFESIPLPQYTYEELAEIIALRLMRDHGRNKALSGAYTEVGLSCAIEPKTLGGKKLPELKTIMIVGGKLITW